MPPIKFYRNIRYLLDQYFLLYFGAIFLIFEISYLFSIKFIKFDGSGQVLIMFCFIIIFMGIAIFLSWYFLEYIKRKQVVSFEITTDGFYCPCILKQDRLIKWDEIKNIKFEVNKGGKYTHFYTLIELVESIQDIEDMHNILFCPHNYYQEKSSGIVLVIPQEVINYYNLKDFTDLLLSFKSKEIDHIHSPYKTNTINYTDSNKGFLILLNLVCLVGVSASTALLCMSVYTFHFQIISSELTIPYIINVISILLLLCGVRMIFRFGIAPLLNFFIEKKYIKTAIEFDDKGIYLINDKSYFPPINWKDFRSCHLVDIKSDKEGVFQPVIEIEFNHSDAKVTKEIIRNTLEGTSVFELQEKLNLYKSSISNPSGSPS